MRTFPYSPFIGVSLFTAFFLISGCTGQGSSTYKATTPIASFGKSISEMNQHELVEALDYWRGQYQSDSNNKEIGMSFASVLRSTNHNDQALAVMEQMAIKHSEDQAVLAAYGKALAGAGKLHKALNAIQRAQTPDNPDWRLHSATGVVLDQLGQSEQARQQYKKALDLRPNEPSVLSNIGMSYLLIGDLTSASIHLRRAAGQIDADSQVRQNLALVLGLQGRFDEAEKVVRLELPEQEARINITYLRQILTSQNSWAKLKKEG